MTKTLYYTLFTYQTWSFYLVRASLGLCFVGSSPASEKEMRDWTAAHFPQAVLTEDPAQLTQEAEAFRAYLSGKSRTLELTIQPVGTDFQKKVWNSLRTVPYGETITYGDLAALIGYSPKAARSVGTALAANPLLIVQPCHRVVPKSQKPRAFRGGLAMKEQLLSLEKADRL